MKKSFKHYSPEFWISIRTLYESGQFPSYETLRAHLTKMMSGQRIPSLQAIKQRSAKEGWNKHISDAEIAEKKAQSITELFESYGMPLQERVRRNVVGIKCIDDINTEIHTLLQTIRKKTEELTGDTDMDALKTTFSEVVEKLPSLAQHLKVSLDYLKNSQALCGDNAPEKRQIMGDKKSTILDKFASLTDDELDKVEQRFRRLGA